MPDPQNVTQVGEDIDPIYTLFEEVQKENARLKRVFAKDPTTREVAAVIVGSIMPIIAQIAAASREHHTAIEDLLNEIEGTTGTQFTLEDAKRFELVVQFALGTAKAALENPELAAGSEAHQKMTEIVETAEACMSTIEESTIVETEEGEPGEETH